MDKPTLAKTLQIAGDYYGKELTPELIKIYDEELGGMTQRDLEESIRHHIRTYKSFPQVAHLRPAGQNTSQDLRQPQHHEHPEWRTHFEAAEKMMRGKLAGEAVEVSGDYLFPLSPLVDRAHEVAMRVERFYEEEPLNDKAQESAAYGGLNVLLANSFGRL